ARPQGHHGGPPSRPSSSRNPGSTAGRTGGRPGPRTTGTGRRRPSRPDPKLLRQRLIVFVVVTLLVALGIALAQKL
ncbi:serine/threonine protein kinase, partial [Streptomyces sp. NPDC048352]